jgi:hypothetical protein
MGERGGTMREQLRARRSMLKREGKRLYVHKTEERARVCEGLGERNITIREGEKHNNTPFKPEPYSIQSTIPFQEIPTVKK